MLRLSNSYPGYLVKHCGSRPAGELLFSAAKKVTKKAATTATPPLKSMGVPIQIQAYSAVPELTHKKHVGSDSCHGKLRINLNLNGLPEVDEGQSQKRCLLKVCTFILLVVGF